MKWLRRAINNWLIGKIPTGEGRAGPVVHPFSYPSNQALQFSVIRAANGVILHTYDYSKDQPSYWVIPDGTSIGQMIDTVMVERRLTK